MIRRFVAWLGGFLLFLLVLELVFRVLPVSTSTQTGYYADPLVMSYPAHHRWTMSTGWDLRNAQVLRANNYGFAADREFVWDTTAVALIGDSYIEASMLSDVDRPGRQLEQALNPARPVYAMGSPGTSLLDYAERIRFAHKTWGTRDFVVFLERGDVMQSLCGSGNVKGACLEPKTLESRVETLVPPGLLKRVLRQSALAQYLTSQIKLTPDKLWRNAFDRVAAPASGGTGNAAQKAIAEPSSPADVELLAYKTISETFFTRVKPHVQGRLVLVLDANRDAIGKGDIAIDASRALFMDLARKAGATVVDMAPAFLAHYHQSALKLEVGPDDKHLNALGVRLVANAAAQALQ